MPEFTEKQLQCLRDLLRAEITRRNALDRANELFDDKIEPINGLEMMACGLAVASDVDNLNDDELLDLFGT